MKNKSGVENGGFLINKHQIKYNTNIHLPGT